MRQLILPGGREAVTRSVMDQIRNDAKKFVSLVGNTRDKLWASSSMRTEIV